MNQLVKYWDKATKLATSFKKFTLLHVPQEQNERTNLLSKLASTQKSEYHRSIIHKKSIDRQLKSWAYVVLSRDGRGSHVGGQAFASKISKAGYYWPTLKSDYCEYVRRNSQGLPKQLRLIMSPCLFYKLGVVILGPFPMVKYLIVAVDYFTRWIEAKPIVTILAERVKRFYYKKLVCHFGHPTAIVLDKGTQFTSRSIAEFCSQLKIKQPFTLVEHPQTNG
ncbi:hypothetical protein CR513_62643, partial [Mucuna pruriens]